MSVIDTLDAPLAYAGPSILGTGEIAAKTFGTWLPAPVESVKRGGVWVHRPLTPRTDRRQIALAAVRQALTETTIPHAYTRTAPHPRHVYDIGLASGVALTRDEINAALIEAMAE